MGTVSHRSMISDTSTKYSISPTPHRPTVAGASSAACDGHSGQGRCRDREGLRADHPEKPCAVDAAED